MNNTDNQNGQGEPERRFAEAATRLLRQSAEELDAATLSRLNRARQAALAELERGSRRPAWVPFGWRPAVAMAAVAVVAVVLSSGRVPLTPRDASPPAPVAAETPLGHVDHAGEIELMLADENLEMLEDLDFYDWLDAGNPADQGESVQGLAG